MNEIVEHLGKWWLPEEPDKEVFGSFRFSPTEGITLELQGHLHPPTDRLFTAPLIMGVTESGELSALLNCHLTNSRMGGGYNSSSLVAEKALKGIGEGKLPFNSAEEIRFQALSIRFAHLDEWFSETMAHFEDRVLENTANIDVDTNSSPQTRPFVIEFKPGESIEADFDSSKITLHTGYYYSHTWRKHIMIDLRPTVEISFEEAKSLQDCSAIICQIQNFLTLGMSVPTYPLEIRGLTGTTWLLDILYAQSTVPPDIRPLISEQMLFTLSDVKGSFDTYLSNWFRSVKALGPVHDLYFGTRYNPHQYLQSAFLSLTQALETYHRRKCGGAYLSNEEYKQAVYPKLVEAIPSDLGDDFKQSLKAGTLRYANEFSLRKRLKDMTTELGEQHLGIAFLNTETSRDNFVGKVVDTRNHLTHYAPDNPVEISPVELLDLVERLWTIAEIYLLREVGFDFAHIRDMTVNHWRYKRVFFRR